MLSVDKMYDTAWGFVAGVVSCAASDLATFSRSQQYEQTKALRAGDKRAARLGAWRRLNTRGQPRAQRASPAKHQARQSAHGAPARRIIRHGVRAGKPGSPVKHQARVAASNPPGRCTLPLSRPRQALGPQSMAPVEGRQRATARQLLRGVPRATG